MRLKLNVLFALAGSYHSFFSFKGIEQPSPDLQRKIKSNAYAIAGAKLLNVFSSRGFFIAGAYNAPPATIVFLMSTTLLLKGYELGQSYELGENISDSVNSKILSANCPY